MLDQISYLQLGLAFAAGLLAKVAGAGTIHYLKQTLIPHFAANTYRHIDLSDKDWRVIHSGDPINGEELESEWKTTMKIHQVGDKLNGEASTTCTKGSKSGTQRFFDVTGTVNNGVVLISMRNKDRAIKSHSAFLLQVAGEGGVLEGYRLFYGMNKSEINGTKCNLVRGKGAPKLACGSG